MIGLSGCTAHDRFALKLNAQLDACAMKRMAETKFNSQQGYLQAHFECHQIVNIQKGHALHMERVDFSARNKKDALEEYAGCWEFVKDLALDKYYPDLRLIEQKSNGHNLTNSEEHENKVTLEFRKLALPNKLSDLNKQKLIMIRDTMNKESVIGHDTLCRQRSYHELSAIIGREVHRRYPNGVDTNVVGNFQ
jgi:hypothetical protein